MKNVALDSQSLFFERSSTFESVTFFDSGKTNVLKAFISLQDERANLVSFEQSEEGAMNRDLSGVLLSLDDCNLVISDVDADKYLIDTDGQLVFDDGYVGNDLVCYIASADGEEDGLTINQGDLYFSVGNFSVNELGELIVESNDADSFSLNSSTGMLIYTS